MSRSGVVRSLTLSLVLLSTHILLSSSESSVSTPPLQCAWSFPDAFVNYDLTSVAGPSAVWTWTSNGIYHTFSFCSSFTTCPGGLASSSALVGPNQCLISYGAAASATATLLASDPTKGLQLVYPGGQSCPMATDSNYSTVLLAACDATQAQNVTIASRSTDSSGCVVTFAVSSAAFCGVLNRPIIIPRALSAYSVIVLVFVNAIILYCTCGAVYKRRTLGARGLESLPNIDFWRSVILKVRVALHFLTCGRFFTDAGTGVDEYKDLMEGPTSEEPGII